MIRTYKYKLYRSKKNKNLHQQIDIAGLIYNHSIALHRRYYRLFGESLNKFQLMKHVTKMKETLLHYVTDGFWVIDFVDGEVIRSRFLKIKSLSASTVRRLLRMGALGPGVMVRRGTKKESV